MKKEHQELLNEIFLGKEDPDMAFKPMTNNLKELKRICTYHSKGGTSGYLLSEEQFEKVNTLINQKEKELLEKVEELLDDRFVGCTGYMPNIDESGNQLYGCLYCGEARSSTVHTISEVRLGIKQLKEELKEEVL